MKHTKKLLALALCLLLCLSLSVTAFATSAAYSGGPKPLSEAALSKVLWIDKDTVDAAFNDVKTFTFSFAAKDDAATPAVGVAAKADHPTIGDLTVTVAKDASHDIATGYTALSTVFTDSLLGNGFNHAGEYIYVVSENGTDYTDTLDSSRANVYKSMDYNSEGAAYEVHVFVGNTDSGLAYQGVTVYRTDGTEGSKKVDPVPGTKDETYFQTKLSDFLFENVYTEEIKKPDDPTFKAFAVTKSITGDLGDKSKTFEISITLTLPDNGKVTASDVVPATGTTITSSTATTVTVTANLADGGEIAFQKIPAGTTFVITETQADGYKSYVTGDFITADSGVDGEGNKTYVAGDRTINSVATGISEKGAVTIENNLARQPDTGIVVNNLPFVLIVALALTGIVVFFVSNRRKVED